MTVWPGIASMALGRWVGRLAGSRIGYGFFTLGKLLALVTIPISLVLYLWRIMPGVCRRYALTSRRVIIRHGLAARDGLSVGLDEFDAIEVAVLPGQQWLRAGDLVFRREGREVFRLCGISRPEGFRRACLKAQNALILGRRVAEQQSAIPQPVAQGSASQ